MSPIYWSWKNISGSLKRVWQNVTRGWNDSDCWNLDNTIAEFTLPRLKKLRETTTGYPSELQNHVEENYKEGLEKWKEILDKMIFSFENIINDNEDIYKLMPRTNFKTIKCKDDEKLYELVHDFKDDKEEKEHNEKFNIFKEKMAERQIKIQEGLDLFSKYFQSLWN